MFLFSPFKIQNLKRRGFSLIELIVYFTIFGIVAALGSGLLVFAIKGRALVSENTKVQLGTERILQQMVERVHSSVTIFDASTSLNLTMASSTLNPTIFRLTSSTITIQEGTGAATSLTPDTILISSLTLTKINNTAPATSSVKIVITAGYNERGSIKPGSNYTLQTTALPLR